MSKATSDPKNPACSSWPCASPSVSLVSGFPCKHVYMLLCVHTCLHNYIQTVMRPCMHACMHACEMVSTANAWHCLMHLCNSLDCLCRLVRGAFLAMIISQDSSKRGIALRKPPAEKPRPAELHRGKQVYYSAAVCLPHACACPTQVMALLRVGRYQNAAHTARPLPQLRSDRS